ESITDLLGSFGKTPPPGEGRGLKAEYFQSDGMNKKSRRVLEREDREMAFDFGEGSPVEGITPEQFSIAWKGSLLAPATGWYEFKIITPNGARLYLNGEPEWSGNSRDDSSAKREIALIDAWVSSGSDLRETKARMFLLGGRSYPIRFDYFKYKETRGMVRLEWKAPRGEWEVLAAPHLSPAAAAHVTVVHADFPADDASEGYERGTSVSKSWHEASTTAAIMVANEVIRRLKILSVVKDDAPDRANQLKNFVATLAERAFRRPLTQPMRELYIERHFSGDIPPEQSVKRAVILIIKSPRFLYPEIGTEKDDFTVAARLALSAWDSLPDQALLDAAKAGLLHTPEQVDAQAQRLIADPRAKAKLNDFFQCWLKLDADADLRKNPDHFPGFDEALVADLRRSLELFVEQVVWSGSSDYRELIQADYLLFNPRLAKFYGVPTSEKEGFHPVKFNPAERSGILTHPYLLARLAHPDSTSPIHRGVFITRNVLGGILKPPPEAIAFENQKFAKDLTMREKISEMTRNASCMTCHETINPLGFSLENFDAVGRYRTTENDKPINAEADYHSLEGVLIHLRGPRDLANHAVESSGARHGFIRQLLQYTLKQNSAVYGQDSLTKLESSFASSGYHIRKLLIEINAHAALHGIGGSPTAKQ
ncbi:MAG: DUF1592 domain-containing protein, partial [Gloeobacteraceae cyanobacterium ES-bin-144]|nr:DUF1592 domain-containing protein [Verrucomicrobiales bacterium]